MRMPTRRWLIPLTLVVLLLPACSADSSADAATTAAPTTVATTTTEATTTRTPDGDRTFVYGTGNCDCYFDSVTEEGDAEILTGTCVCLTHGSDPRVSGSEELPMTLAMFPDRVPEVHWFEYDTATLTSDVGTWRNGEGFGSEFFNEDGDLLTSGHTTYVGDGAFEGLTYEYFYAQSNAFTTADDPRESYRFSGWIEPTVAADSDG
jgi:hypothetical protein